MYSAKFYQGMTEEEISKSAQSEGFRPIQIYNSPGDIYPPHSHATTKILAILAGSMKARVGKKWFACTKFDKLVIPGNVEHEAIVGKVGCRFFWSEKLL